MRGESGSLLLLSVLLPLSHHAAAEQRSRVSLTLLVEGGTTAVAEQLLREGSDANQAVVGGVVRLLNDRAVSFGRAVQAGDVAVTAAEVSRRRAAVLLNESKAHITHSEMKPDF